MPANALEGFSFDVASILDEVLRQYLAGCQQRVLEQIQEIVSFRGHVRYQPVLYELMLDYPLRTAKALRPALCIALCRALGGTLEAALPSAAVLELFHNAFLVHDDIEDASLLRRGQPTLHQNHGVSVAINVGDGMLALTLGPLLDNTRLLGLGKALRVLEVVARMARESVEGQALELDWVRHEIWDLEDRDYRLMAYKKTCWYTFIAPALLGGIIGGATPYRASLLARFAALLGVAFQIQDDILNLAAEEETYGKEIDGDLAEGKRTLILLHMMRSAASHEREEARRILAQPRVDKTPSDIRRLRDLIATHRSIEYARGIALRYARCAELVFARTEPWLAPSVHVDFVRSLIGYVIHREC